MVKEYDPVITILNVFYILLIHVHGLENIASATGRKRSADESTDGVQHK